MTHAIRLRAHIEPQESMAAPLTDGRRWSDGAPRRAFVISTVVDEHDRPVVTFYRELLDGRTIEEGVAVHDPDRLAEVERWAAEQRPDLPPGMVAEFQVLTPYKLSRKIISRCYRYGIPLVGWDLPWQLGRLAGHVGRAKDGGFSITLLGCGVEKQDHWKDSDYCPRIRITPRGSGQAGAFLRWLPCRDESSRSKSRGQRFMELANLTSAVLGGVVSSQSHAAQLFGVDWPKADLDLDFGRVECGMAVKLFLAGCRRLQELAPGLAPHKAWSTGSIAAHIRRRSGIRPAATAVKEVPMSVKGAIAAAFLGPRCECHLPGIAVPMALVDLKGTYPGCWCAQDLTRLHIAEHIEFEDATEEFIEFLRSPNLRRRLIDPVTARTWAASVVLVKSSEGADLPAMPEWEPNRIKGTLAPLYLPEDSGLPMPWCDVALAVDRSGDLQVERVFRPVAVGVQPDLRPYRMPDGVEVDPTTECLGCAWRDYRDRSGSGVAKLGGNADTFGLPSRHDGKRIPQAVDLTGFGPDGMPHTIRTRTPEYPATDTSPLLAGAVTAMCRMVMGLFQTMLEGEGFTVAHIATDSEAVPASAEGGLWPCPGGKHHLPDGSPAIRLASFTQLRSILARFDLLLGHRGGPAWKEEVESLTVPTVGVVFGVNKVVLGRQREDGNWAVVRSTDADLGGHLLDPTGTGLRTEDGRWAWAADLEGLLLEAAFDLPHDRPITVPVDLPDYAYRLALRVERASTWTDLQRLRRETGDPAVMPFARYVRAERGGKGGGPVALGHHSDPDKWSDLDFRLAGESVALVVPGSSEQPMHIAGDPKAQRKIVVRTVADHLARWLHEVDPSMEGPARGLRTPVPVRTHPALFHLVGRAGEVLADGTELPSLVLGSAEGWMELRRRARLIGAPQVADFSGIPRRTISDALSKDTPPTDATLAGIVGAVTRAHWRLCPQCQQPFTGRSDKRTCSDKCRKAARRAAVQVEILAARPPVTDPGAPKPADRTWIERDPVWTEHNQRSNPQ